MFVSWASFMVTSIPKVPRYILLLKNCCYRIHTAALLLPVMVMPPIISILQAACSILLAQNSFVFGSFNEKRTALDEQAFLAGEPISKSLRPLNNYYFSIFGKYFKEGSSLPSKWFSTRLEHCVRQKTLDHLAGMDIKPTPLG